MEFNLDHFYSSLPSSAFDNLIPLSKLFSHAMHRLVKREDMSDEGIYLFTQSGHYLELLRSETSKYVGIALNSFNSPNVVLSGIHNPDPENYTWSSEDTVNRPKDVEDTGKPWFNPIILKINDTSDKSQSSKDKGTFGSWIINYHNDQHHRVYQSYVAYNSANVTHRVKYETEPFDIIQVESVVIVIPPELRSSVLNGISWCANEIIKQDELISCIFNNPNGADIPFTFRIDAESNLGFQKIVFLINDSTKYMNLDKIGPITFSLEENLLSLQFDDYWG
jgi:hypothetical protein